MISTYTAWSLFAFILLLGVITVNGFTDAPTSITSSVTSKALTMRQACVISAFFNFLGVILGSFLGFGVSSTVAQLGNNGSGKEMCACLLTVIIFGLLTWLFRMPSSESVALISALAATSYFKTGDLNAKTLFPILLFTVLCCIMSFLLSMLSFLAIKKAPLNFRSLNIGLCSVSSFIHGWQDGGKFIGLFLILFKFSDTSKDFFAVLPCIFTVAIFLFLGTLLGGGRIVKELGENTVKLTEVSCAASDIGCLLSLFVCTALGIPTSTGYAKSTSIIGAGIGDKKKVNKKSALLQIVTCLITIPFCFVLGYFLCSLFQKIGG